MFARLIESRFVFAAEVVIFTCCLIPFGRLASAQDLRLNQIQTIGTHNSYHVAPHPNLLQLIRVASPAIGDSIDYTHKPLDDQLERLKIRQIELDVYADPDGGRFSSPVGYQTMISSGLEAGEDPNLNGVLDRPGLKIIHGPGFDYRTTVPTFKAALTKIRQWSKMNPEHIPIMILVELKDSVVGPAGVSALPFDHQQLDGVDAEIRAVFAEAELITPDSVRRDKPTLKEAITELGWPKLSQCRGKVLFALDNGGVLRDRYLEGHESLEGRVMFATVPTDHPAAAFLKLNDPVGDFEMIQQVVRQGFIVRTRADADTVQARRHDTSQRDQAFASGAQYISTDYPEPDQRLSTYCVRLEENAEYRINPVSGEIADQ